MDRQTYQQTGRHTDKGAETEEWTKARELLVDEQTDEYSGRQTNEHIDRNIKKMHRSTDMER